MQLRSTQQSRRLLLLLLFNFILSLTYSLKCRSEDGPSDAELKRVARTCMHKISENSYSSKRTSSGGTSGSSQTSTGANANSYYGQQQQQSDQQYQRGQDSNNKNYYGYDDDIQRDENSGNNYRGYNKYERIDSNDMLRKRNQERMQNSHSARSHRSASVLFNFERVSNGNGRYDQSSNNGRNSHGGGNSNSGGNAGNNNGGSSSRDHRSSSSTNSYSSSNNNNYNSSLHDHDRQSQDSACIVHCFFEEMNMLNKDDYPDKHKVTYLLTKEMRDRELRSFYTETIQECFHYLYSQRQRDKCHFSRDLIHCMTEYAKANCDDWDDYSIMFN